MKKPLLDRVILYSLIVLNVAFFVYWVILAYYSQPHYDDLHFLWKTRDMSLFGYIKDMYITRSGRFFSYMINGIKSVVISFLGFHQGWALFYYLLGLGICWLVIKDIQLPIDRLEKITGMCFIYNLYVLTNIDFPVFFWLCAMDYYLLFPTACLLLRYLFMEKLNWKQWLAFVVLIVYTGGGIEAFSPIVLLAMFFCGLYWWRSKGWNIKETWSLPQVKRIVWTAVVMLILIAIVVAAPGNYARMSDTSQFVHPNGLGGWIKAIGDAIVKFFYFMAFYIPYYLVAFTLAFYIGGRSEYHLSITKLKLVIGLLLLFLVYLLISSLPNVYLYNGFGLMRTYIPVVFAFLLIIIAIGYILGMGRKSAFSGWCSVVGAWVLTVIMCINIKDDTPSARAYGKAVEQRIDYLCALRDQGQKGTVIVEPLPKPYTEDVKHFVLTKLGKDTPKTLLYYISDVGQKPNEYERHMKRCLNLDFDFVVSDDAALGNE